MSIKVQTYVWEHSKARGSALLLLLAIADFSHDDGCGAWPSMETLSKKCRQSIRNVAYLLDKLQGLGELNIIPNAGPHGCNLYEIALHAKFAGRETQDVPTGKTARQISPDPLGTERENKEDNISLSTDSPAIQRDEKEFAAMFQTVEGAMGGELSPGECELLKDLWKERPDFNAHHYAFLQTRDHAAGFNLSYYQKCLRGFNGNKRQIQVVTDGTWRGSG